MSRRTVDDLACLLDDIVAYVRRFVVLNDAELCAIALWTLHTFALEAVDTTPYLSVAKSPPSPIRTRLRQRSAVVP